MIILILAFICTTMAMAQQSIQAEHDQFLIDSNNKIMLTGEALELKINDCPQCPPDQKLDISLRILGNKFSIYARLGRKALHEQGVVSLKNEVGFLGYIQLKKEENQAKFAITFLLDKEVSLVIKENLSQVFGKPIFDNFFLRSAARVFPSLKANLNTENYKSVILIFAESQRILFYTLLKPESPQPEPPHPGTQIPYLDTLDNEQSTLHQTNVQNERWSCPNCGKDLGLDYGCKYCRKCYGCYVWGIQKCPYCGSWENGPANYCKYCNYCWK